MNSLVQTIARRRPSWASVLVVVLAAAVIGAAITMTFELISVQAGLAGLWD
jgi:uncharacterized protein involved in cysteine biosynthesis